MSKLRLALLSLLTAAAIVFYVKKADAEFYWYNEDGYPVVIPLDCEQLAYLKEQTLAIGKDIIEGQIECMTVSPVIKNECFIFHWRMSGLTDLLSTINEDYSASCAEASGSGSLSPSSSSFSTSAT